MTNEIFTQSCPFCGASKNDIAVSKCLQEVKIVCLKCSAEFALSNHFRNEKQAVINAWNSRSVTAAAVMGYEAALAERTCTNISNPPEGFLCSECRWGDFAEPSHLLTTAKFTDNEHGPNFCPNCGAKVVDR